SAGGDRGRRRKQLDRVHGLAEAPDLEVELHAVGIRRSHLGDALAPGDGLPLLHEQLAVVGVDAQKLVVMLDDDELAEAPYPGPAENYAAGGAGEHRLSQLARDADALQLRAVVEAADDGPGGGPGPDKRPAFGLARLGRIGFRPSRAGGELRIRLVAVGNVHGTRLRLDVPGRRRISDGAALHAGRGLQRSRGDGRGRLQPQALPDADRGSVLESVPLGELAVIEAVVERDAVEGVAG